MPRIATVLALAVLSFAGLCTPSTVSGRESRLVHEVSQARIRSLEHQVEQLTQTLQQVQEKVDLSGDEYSPANHHDGDPRDCPMSHLHATQPQDDTELEVAETRVPTVYSRRTSIIASIDDAQGSGSGSAADKASAVWSSVLADSTPGSYPSTFGLLKIFVEDMSVTMKTVDDVMPSSHTKLIHSVGGHALGTLTWDTPLPYTGLFQTGSQHTVIRLSSAKDPANTSVTAGVSLKVFRDNTPSANSFFLNSFASTSWNFFNLNLQNHVSSKLSTFDPAKLLLKKFQTASQYAFYTGLSDWARYDEQGNVTPDDKIKFPFQLILVPNPTLKAAGASLQPDGQIFTNQFNVIEPGTQLYSVYIQDEPFATPYQAGKLTLAADTTGKLTTSLYGDQTLFFKHQAFEEDFALRSDWKSTCPKPETCEYMF